MPAILFPKEHGALAMFFIPLVIGLLVSGEWGMQGFLLLGAALFWYLARYPATLLLTSQRTPVGWAILYTSLASLFSIPLVLSYGLSLLLAFGAFFLFSFVIHVIVTRAGRARSLPAEFFAVASLSSTSALAHYVGAERLEIQGLILWMLCFLYFGESVFYVRLKVSGTDSAFWGTLAYAFAAFFLALSLSLCGITPPLSFVAFLPVTVKSVRGAREKEKVGIRDIGYIEAAHAVFFAILLVVSYAL